MEMLRADAQSHAAPEPQLLLMPFPRPDQIRISNAFILKIALPGLYRHLVATRKGRLS
jgi:hypothetical protein